MSGKQKVTPFLWYDGTAEEAANFYVTLFKNSKVTGKTPGPGGKPMTVTFTLDGQPYIALNGGPHYRLNAAFSLFVDCEDQGEVDDLWGKLTANGGRENQCGWLIDKFGLSWQIIPKALTRLMSDPDPAKSKRVVDAMLKMQKIDVPTLEKAHRGA
jgi:predicted 3-demethylubiquinone-9 3-methyltransferase (glyoxalase superfamily)